MFRQLTSGLHRISLENYLVEILWFTFKIFFSDLYADIVII